MLPRVRVLLYCLRQTCQTCPRQADLSTNFCTPQQHLRTSLWQALGLFSDPLERPNTLHSTALQAANPDNKPPPSGKDRFDTSNNKDNIGEDPEDSSDWAPGYYDSKGSGGHREIASPKQAHTEQDISQEMTPGEKRKDWQPQEADDPTAAKSEDPLKPNIPDFGVGNSEDSSKQQSSTGTAGPKVDSHTQVAGMKESNT